MGYVKSTNTHFKSTSLHVRSKQNSCYGQKHFRCVLAPNQWISENLESATFREREEEMPAFQCYIRLRLQKKLIKTLVVRGILLPMMECYVFEESAWIYKCEKTYSETAQEAKHFKSFHLMLVPTIWRNNQHRGNYQINVDFLGENKKLRLTWITALHLFY